MSDSPKYTKAGEMHRRKAASTGDSYLSGVLSIEHNGEKLSIPLTIFMRKSKLHPNAPDADIYVGSSEPVIVEQPKGVDDIPF